MGEETMGRRDPQIQTHTITNVTDDGDGEWTVTMKNGAFLTVCHDDLPRPPQPGDRVRVQLPMVIGFATKLDAPRYEDRELVRRAMRNVRSGGPSSTPRWAAVTTTFGVGSTVATNLCIEHGLDPDETVPGRCLED